MCRRTTREYYIILYTYDGSKKKKLYNYIVFYATIHKQTNITYTMAGWQPVLLL